jgi:ABC-2 type transport system permease protein
MKLFDIALKDLIRSFRSLFAVGMMFAAPLVITGLIYMAFGGISTNRGKFDLPNLKLAVVNLDQAVVGQPAFGKMVSEFLKDKAMPAWLVVSEMPDEASALAAFGKQEIGAAVIIPPDFSKAVYDPQAQAVIKVLQDPALSLGPSFIKTVLDMFVEGISGTRVAITVAQRGFKAAGLELDPVTLQKVIGQYSTWYTALQQNLKHGDQPLLQVQSPANPGQNSDQMAQIIALIMAGQLIFFSFYTGAYSMTSILKEDEEGTLARLFTTPTPRTTILAGKFLAVFAMVVVQALVLMVVSNAVFHIKWGQPLTVALVTLGQVASAGGFGVLLISLVKHSRQSGPVLGGGLTAAGMLGGLFTVAVPMPAAFTMVSMITPQGWALKAWRLALTGASIGETLLPVGMLLLLGLFFFTAGALIFRKRFAW